MQTVMIAGRFAHALAALTTRPSRRSVIRALSGLGLARVFAPADAATKRRKKKCAKAGQTTNKKHKKCCKGLVKDGSGICSEPPCVPRTCPANGCGSLSDGCGGKLSCGSCPANQICLRSGVCQACDVNCVSDPATCGANLQFAMDEGGTIYVCPGRYQGNFILRDAARIVGAGEGAGVAANTILDGHQQGRVLELREVEGLVELEQLRITGGTTSSFGGGILHNGTTLRMTDCTVNGNNLMDGDRSFGGGIYAGSSTSLVLTRCTISDNFVRGTPGRGGGLFTEGRTTLTDCLVEHNDAIQGGGLWINGGRTTLTGNSHVRLNEGQLAGGGIVVQTGTLVIEETCRVTENTANTVGSGGGIRRLASTVTLLGADPSPIVVNNCHENCGGNPVTKCAATPVSCTP